MFKSLSPRALGLSGRQSELIELALTYGFRSMDVDMADLAKRARTSSIEHAIRFLASAQMRIGTFDLPVDCTADEATFASQLTWLEEVCQVAAALKAQRSVLVIAPASDEYPFPENFELHRRRIGQVADLLAKFQICLGLSLRSLRSDREGKTYQFICDTEGLAALQKSIPATNVGFLIDTFHWFLGGGTLRELADLPKNFIVGVRLADYPRDEDPNTFDEQARRLPGEGGSVDCQALVNLLAQSNYEGPVTLFPHPSCFRGLTRDGIVQRVAEVMDELWRGAGLAKPKAVGAATDSAP